MTYEDFAQVNEEHKLNLKNYLNSLQKLQEAREIEVAKKSHAFKARLSQNNDFLILSTDTEDLPPCLRLERIIHDACELYAFFQNSKLNYISNISFLRDNFSKIGKFIFSWLNDPDITGVLYNYNHYDMLRLCKVDNLRKALGKMVLKGGKILLNLCDCFAMVFVNNTLYMISDLDMVLLSTSNLNFSGLDIKCIYISDLLNQKRNLSNFFFDSTVETIVLKNFDTSFVSTMQSMFEHCINLRSVNVEELNTCRVSSFASMFRNCKSLEELNLNNWDVRNAENMNNMFEGCTNLKKLSIDKWVTPKLRYKEYFIDDCISLDKSQYKKLNLGKRGK